MVIILGAAFFGIPVSRRVIPPLVITYVGLAIMYGHDLDMAPAGSSSADITKGTLLILASALCYALYILFSKRGVAELGSLLFTRGGAQHHLSGRLLRQFIPQINADHQIQRQCQQHTHTQQRNGRHAEPVQPLNDDGFH